jgi:hypothetical protein
MVRYDSGNVNLYYQTFKIRAVSVAGLNVTYTTGIDYYDGVNANGALFNHNFVIGDKIEIIGTVSNTATATTVAREEFDGKFTVTNVGANTFTVAFGTAPSGSGLTLPAAVENYGRVGLLGWFLYGGTAEASPSIAPFEATVLDYGKVKLSWSGRPIGTTTEPIVKFRLLRNQQGISETAEDGVVLIDAVITNKPKLSDGETPTYSSPTTGPYVDYPEQTGTTPIVEGRACHYSVWVLLEDTTVSNNSRFFWKRIDAVTVIVPDQHNEVLGGDNRSRNTHNKVMHLLPRVITSGENDSLGEISQTTDIYNFMYGVSFTVDEMYTALDALLPDPAGQRQLPPLVNLTLLDYGLPGDNIEFSQSRRKLARDARKIVSGKGTSDSMGIFAEDLTGYAPTVRNTADLNTTASDAVVYSGKGNMMLTVQDATFYKGVGNWTASDSSTIATETATAVPAAQALAIDTTYSGKVIVNANDNSISNGASAPTTRGIPVVAGQTYTFSAYLRTASSTSTDTLSITWYNQFGTSLSTTSSTYSATTAWGRGSETEVAPTGAAYASLKIAFGTSGTRYVDMVQFEKNSSASDYYEPRGLLLKLNSTKQNFIPNPSFEHGTPGTGWTTTGTASTDTDTPVGVITGTKSLKLTGSSSAVSAAIADIAITNNSYWTLSYYVKASTTVNVTTTIGGVTGVTDVTGVTSVGTDWVRVISTIFIPQSVTSPQLDISITSASFTGSVYLDAVQLEPRYFASDYFDGSNLDALWTGTVNNSKSIGYAAKNYKLPALIQNLPSQLPSGAPYYVVSELGTIFDSTCLGFAE